MDVNDISADIEGVLKTNHLNAIKNEVRKAGLIAAEQVADNMELFFQMALDMLSVIRTNNDAGKPSVLIVPVGPTGQYYYLARMVNRLKISLKQTFFINMDEYLDENDRWLSIENPLSFRRQMDQLFYNCIDAEYNIPEAQRIFPHPDTPDKISDLIKSLGGADACFGGIGINGHVAFNEPPGSVSLNEFSGCTTRIVSLSTETLVINSIAAMGGNYKAMPAKAITIGMKEILEAKQVRLYVMREWHKAVLYSIIHDPANVSLPASLLQKHPDCKIYYTANVGA